GASRPACRRPGMKTWAPSATNRRAVARPMPLLPPVMTATLPSNFFDMGLPPLPVRDVRVKGCKSDCLPRGIRPAGSRRLYQAEQAPRDDLPRLLDQFVKDLTGRLDLADQAHALARQQIHRIDVATRLAIRREPPEAECVPPAAKNIAQPATSRRDANSPIMMLGALVLAEGIVGMTEASAMRRPLTPRTPSSASTTASSPDPIAQVPTGWR